MGDVVVPRCRTELTLLCCGTVLATLFAGCASWNQQTLGDMRALENQLPVGLPRQEAYRRIRSRGMIARNVDYTHWRVEGHAAIPLDHGEWPTAGETYPPSPDDLYLHMNRYRPSPASPPAEVIIGGGFFFGCGLEAWLDIDFDSHDRISKVRERIDKRC